MYLKHQGFKRPLEFEPQRDLFYVATDLMPARWVCDHFFRLDRSADHLNSVFARRDSNTTLVQSLRRRNHGQCIDRLICDRNVNEIIKKSVVKVKRCERPSDLEVSGHSLRVGAAQDLLTKGYDLAANMRAGG